MKKTLLGVLAFILVLATVLTGSVMIASADEAGNELGQKAADVKKVPAGTPIEVDGQMDKAYADATPLYLASYDSTATGIYTYGIARFVWSEDQNALYCFMIINDADVGAPAYDDSYKVEKPWVADSVELFVDFTTDGLTKDSWGITGGQVMSRGLQYRIDGSNGTATCYLAEYAKQFKENNPDWKHPTSGKAHYDAYATYYFTNGAWKNQYDSKLTADVFGWTASDDLTKQGWGYEDILGEGMGYTLEFRIEATMVEEKLHAGQNVKFDMQANDRYAGNRPGDNRVSQFFYSSTYRIAKADELTAATAADCKYYDWLTLSDEEADNNGPAYTGAQLTEFGSADATTSKTEPTTPRPINQTPKRSWTPKVTSAIQANSGTTAPAGPDKPGDNTQNPGDNTGDNTSSGGCGSAITVGASVAAVAVLGAAGFFAFRKKDEE